MIDENVNIMSGEKKKEDWMNSKWRPACGWMYIVVCLFDFMIAPILWSLLQSISHGAVNSQWQPLTLQGAGLFHVAMGAVLGITAHGRTQEKLSGTNNGSLGHPSGSTGVVNNGNTTSSTTGFSSGSTTTSIPTSGFDTPTGSFSTSTASTGLAGNTTIGATTYSTPTVVTGFGGKPAPAPQQDPLL